MLKKVNIHSLKLTLIAFIIMLYVPPAGAAFRYLDTGMQPPPIKGNEILTGEEITYDGQTSYKAVLVVFWATWSKRSLEQLADLQELYDQTGGNGWLIIAVNVENQKITGPLQDKIIQTFKSLNVTYPGIIDVNLELFYDYGVIAVPSTALMDSTGTLRYAPAGYSLAIKDKIVDSILVMLGLREAGKEMALETGYKADLVSSRYYRLAARLFNQRMYEKALSNLNLAVENDSLFPAPYNLRGQVLLVLDSVTSAKENFEKALRLDSLSTVYWTEYGRAYLKESNLDSAKICLNIAVALDSLYTPALLNLAICFSESGEHERAINLMRSAMELNPQDVEAYYHLGKVYKASNQMDLAIESFKKGLNLYFSLK